MSSTGHIGTDSASPPPSASEAAPEKRVDPAALLVAVLAVGVGPLYEDGAWAWTNTAVAALVLTVILCFIVPARQSLQARAWKERVPIALAQALVVGFITVIGSALFFQQLPSTEELFRFCGLEPTVTAELVRRWYWASCEATLVDQAASAATPWALIPGGVIATALFLWLWWPRKAQS